MRAAAALALALLAPAQGWTGPLSAPQRALCARGSRQDRAGWIRLHLEGDARARGFQHGYLMAPEIREGLKASRIAWEHLTGTAWSELLVKASTFFVPSVDPENLRELEAMAEGLAAAGVATNRDVARNEERPGGRSLCAHFDLEPESLWDAPFEPAGTTDAKVVDSALALKMSFAARFGSACGRPFDAAKFLKDHPQFGWLQGILPSRGAWPWVVFSAGPE